MEEIFKEGTEDRPVTDPEAAAADTAEAKVQPETDHEGAPSELFGLPWLSGDIPDSEMIARQRIVIIAMCGVCALLFIVALVQTLTKGIMKKQLDMASELTVNAEDSAGGYMSGMTNLQDYVKELQLALTDEEKKSQTLQKQVTELNRQLEDLKSEAAGERTAAPEPEAELSEEGGEGAADGTEGGEGEASSAEESGSVNTVMAQSAREVTLTNMEKQLASEALLSKKVALEEFESRGIALEPLNDLRLTPGEEGEGEEGTEGEEGEEGGEGHEEGEEENPDRGKTTSSPSGVYKFTDKNGDKTTFTSDEWEYLLSIWEYTGKAQEMLEEHTVGELKSALATR